MFMKFVDVGFRYEIYICNLHVNAIYNIEKTFENINNITLTYYLPGI